ncbi:MAG TPA: hypothetical protein VGO60_00310 [Iamia sp.]|jgi:hypothetical protein|nr:hypothetical protein [Iamia sp.]
MPDPRSAPPEDRAGLLLRPDVLVALGLLVLNDRWLKGRGPGWFTGKLSDVVGVYLFPLVLVATAEVACRVVRARPPERARALGLAAGVTAAAFAAVKLSAPIGDLFQVTFGWLRWPLSAGESWFAGDGFRARAHVELVRDPTDLVAVPMAGVAWLVHGRGRGGDVRRRGSTGRR